MAAPEDVDVWVGLDVGKDEHFADVLDDTGDGLFACLMSTDKPDTWAGRPSTPRRTLWSTSAA